MDDLVGGLVLGVGVDVGGGTIEYRIQNTEYRIQNTLRITETQLAR